MIHIGNRGEIKAVGGSLSELAADASLITSVVISIARERGLRAEDYWKAIIVSVNDTLKDKGIAEATIKLLDERGYLREEGREKEESKR